MKPRLPIDLGVVRQGRKLLNSIFFVDSFNNVIFEFSALIKAEFPQE